jgi:hypothetical protein
VWVRILVVALVAVILSACDDAGRERDDVVAWTETGPLPAPPGGTVVLRDGTWCGDHWVVVGAVRRGDDTVPAAWSSPDGRAWAPVAIHPHSYYGRRAILFSVACVGAEPVAVGERSGGAHGNRRVTTFRAAGDGWTDVAAPFELYGGPRALDVGPVSAGPDAWLIAGNRLDGPAVWFARSPRRFEIVESAPGLVGGSDLAIASQAAWLDGAWHLVGGASVGTERQPLAWTSADGREWTRDEVPKGSALDDMERIVAVGDGLIAVGRSSDGFAVWRSTAGTWSRLGTFGAASQDGGLPDVVDLDVQGRTFDAVVSDGATYQLWTSQDGVSWHRSALPAEIRSSGDAAVATAASPRSLLLLSDDGSAATVWARSGEGPP